MLKPNFQPRFLDEQECKENATRQILSFITLADTKEGDPPDVRPAPGASLFLYGDLLDEAFVDGPELFNWKSRDIYDVDGLLLFRDQTIELGDGREWHVRTAASDLLQTPVWCDCFKGPTDPNDKTPIDKALEEIRNHTDLEPFIVSDEAQIRLVAYSYPNLGILCYSRHDPNARFVSKLGEPLIIPLEPDKPAENPESLFAVWSPYDTLGRHGTAHFRQLWKQNLALLPPLPRNRQELPDKIREARKSVLDEHIVIPKVPLISQKTPKTCAVATALMILEHHGIDIARLNQLGVTEDQIATNMRCQPSGAPPAEQVKEVNRLLALAGSNLRAVPDADPTYNKARDEISKDRPLKLGGGHARVIAGFKVLGDQDWLWIYDPLPENQGKTCCVPWTQGTQQDFMYVRPS